LFHFLKEESLAQVFDTPLFSSDQSIDRVLSAGLPVVVVFLDGPAPSALEQAMKSMAKQNAGKLLVVQLHVKDSPQTARRFAVQSTPALVTVKNGQEQSKAAGISADDLERHVNFALGKGPRPEPKASPQYNGAGAAGASAGGPSSGYGSGESAQGTDKASTQPVTVTDATFDQEVMRSPVPVVVDFWAPWCGPCRMVAPVLDKLAREWSGKVKIAKVNVDENPKVAGRLGVQAIPTMLVVKSGSIVDRWAGALPEPAMRSRLGSQIR
jgi:thioredoxin 1